MGSIRGEPVVVAGQVRLVPTVEHSDWLTLALPGGGFCRHEPDLVLGWRKRGRGHAVSPLARKGRRRGRFRKRQRQAPGRERVTHDVVSGGFQSVFTHERHTTSGDTLRSRCEGEGSFFARQPIILYHLSFALKPNTSRSEYLLLQEISQKINRFVKIGGKIRENKLLWGELSSWTAGGPAYDEMKCRKRWQQFLLLAKWSVNEVTKKIDSFINKITTENN